MDEFIKLAKQSINFFLEKNRLLPTPSNLPPQLSRTAGIFVTLLRRQDHSLRGCIGTFMPTQPNIAQEIIHNSVAAAFEDSRFPPLKISDMPDLEIHVDEICRLETIKGIENNDPDKYGLIVSDQNQRRGLLLPDVGVNSAEEQFRICCAKAGIDPLEKGLIFQRFKVIRHQ